MMLWASSGRVTTQSLSPALPDDNLRFQEALDWRKWTKRLCSFPAVLHRSRRSVSSSSHSTELEPDKRPRMQRVNLKDCRCTIMIRDGFIPQNQCTEAMGAGPRWSRAQTQTENEFADIASRGSREISGEHTTHKIGGCWRKDLESTTSDPGKAEHAGNFEFFLGNYLQSLIRIFL